VTNAEELEAILGLPGEAAVHKQIDQLDEHCRRFIGLSPLLLMSTANRAGWCDVSPKGDAPGFVRVIADNHLAIPDRPGNRRADSLRNILENPQIGLLFLIPGMRETLRVNGRACISADPDLLATLAVDEKTPQLAIGVTVQEVYLHCGKALIRSHLWQPTTWPEPANLPSASAIFTDHIRLPRFTQETGDQILEDDYTNGLY
jgi:hypothetical protein